MITTKLLFRPHVIWSTEQGFHVFGYEKSQSWRQKVYCHYFNGETQKHILSLSEALHFNHAYAHDGGFCLVHRYHLGFIEENNLVVRSLLINEVTKSGYSDSVKLANAFVALIDAMNAYDTAFLKLSKFVKNTSKTAGFIEDGVHHFVKRIRYRRTHYSTDWTRPPVSANFDFDANNLVFSWGRRLWINNHCIKFPTNCYDARLSHDGSTVAVAVGDEIMFVDTKSYEVKNRLSTNNTLHHLAYSMDGLTLGSITKCGRMIVWDLD